MEDGHGESFHGLQSKRYHRLLAALFSDMRRKARFELLVEVEGVVVWNIEGRSIKVASQTTDLVMSPKIKETLMYAYHTTKPENLKSILGEGLKPGHELFEEGGRNAGICHPSRPVANGPEKCWASGCDTRPRGSRSLSWSSST